MISIEVYIIAAYHFKVRSVAIATHTKYIASPTTLQLPVPTSAKPPRPWPRLPAETRRQIAQSLATLLLRRHAAIHPARRQRSARFFAPTAIVAVRIGPPPTTAEINRVPASLSQPHAPRIALEQGSAQLFLQRFPVH